MARRTLRRILASFRSTAHAAAWYGACAAEAESDPASDTELDRNDYQRLADEHTAIGVELLEEAALMLRRASKAQLATWLAHPDARVRQFVIEWMNVRD